MTLEQLKNISDYFNGLVVKAELEQDLALQYQYISADSNLKDVLDDIAKADQPKTQPAKEPPKVEEKNKKEEPEVEEEETTEAGGSIGSYVSDGLDFAGGLNFANPTIEYGEVDNDIQSALPSVNWGDSKMDSEEDEEENEE